MEPKRRPERLSLAMNPSNSPIRESEQRTRLRLVSRATSDVTTGETATDSVELIDSSGVPIMSFEDFYRLNCDGVSKALALTLGDHSLGLEAADEGFTRAFGRWGQVSGYANPEGWVYRVGLNWGRSWLRTKARALSKRPLLAASSGLAYSAQSADPSEHVADPQLRAALLELSRHHREVIVLRYYLDWSTEQTANALDIAPGTVKSRLNRALAQLSATLGQPYCGPTIAGARR